MSFQVRTTRVDNEMKIIIMRPHGRRWQRVHTHQFTLKEDTPVSEQLRGELHLALGASGIADGGNKPSGTVQ